MLHHKGRNKHHYEYWIDYSLDGKKILAGMKMPVNYVVEMFLDRIAASKVYKGSRYKDTDPLEYYMNGKAGDLMHPETRALLERLLRMLAEQGEDKTYRFIRQKVLRRGFFPGTNLNWHRTVYAGGQKKKNVPESIRGEKEVQNGEKEEDVSGVPVCRTGFLFFFYVLVIPDNITGNRECLSGHWSKIFGQDILPWEGSYPDSFRSLSQRRQGSLLRKMR